MTNTDKLVLWAGRSLILIGVLHLLVLGTDAFTYVAGWLRLHLWTSEHNQPAAQFDPDLLLSLHAFWSTLGSFAVPLMLLGALLITLARRSIHIPAFVGWVLALWSLMCALVIEPSGFPLGLIPAGLLMVASGRAGRQPA